MLRKMRLVNTLKHGKNAGFETENIVFYKTVARVMTGIVKILYGKNFRYNANETQNYAHHFFSTLLVLVIKYLLWLRSVLKIRVSVVRFHSRPPYSHPQRTQS